MEMRVRSVRLFLNRFSNWLPISWLAKSNSDDNVGEILHATLSTKPSKKYRNKKKKVSISWGGVKGYRCGYARIPAEPSILYLQNSGLSMYNPANASPGTSFHFHKDVIRRFTGLYTGEHGDSGLIRIPARSFTKPQNMKQGRFGDYAGMRMTELSH
jgi:hypothetical protein